MKKISGGDEVRLKNGKIVTVYDIKNKEIIVTYVERYPFTEIEEIIRKERK